MSFITRLGQLRSPVTTYANLPLTENVLGDVRLATDTGDAYTWMISASSGSLTDWKKVTTSSYNDLEGAPEASGLAIDDAVQVITSLSINIALIAFQTLTGYGASIARMFDGQVSQTKESDGMDDPSPIEDESSENYIQQSDHVMPNKNDLDIYTKFLVHGDGTQGSTSFVDLLRRTITSYGAITDTTIKKFGTGSIKFDGANDYVDIGVADLINWECLDFWFYSNTSGEQPIMGNSQSTDPEPLDFAPGECITIKKNSANKIEVLLKKYTDIPEEPYRAWEDLTVTSASTVSSGAWHHIAIQVVDDYLQIWIDGVLDATSEDAVEGYYEVGNYAYQVYLGRIGSSYLNGYLDEIRYSNTTRYTTTFTPMTRAYNTAISPLPSYDISDYSDSEHVITAHGNARLSGNNFSFANASLYLDGIDSYLTVPDSDDFELAEEIGGGQDIHTKVLLHGDGVNGSQTIIDNSYNPKSVTAFGNTQIDTSNPKFGTGAIKFDGSGDYLAIPDSSEFIIANYDFTIDTWINFSTINPNSYQIFINQFGLLDRAFQCYMHFNGSSIGDINIQANNTNEVLKVASWSWTPTINTWYHIAFVRSSGLANCYINGIALSTIDQDLNISIADSSTAFEIGRQTESNNYYFSGSIDEFRFSNGVARWTSNFTPPSSPYSTGTTGTDFTVDLWIDPLSFSDLNAYIIGVDDSWKLTFDGTSNHYLKFSFVGGNYLIATTSLQVNIWYHVAIVQYSGILKMYINGILAGSISAEPTTNTAAVLSIGATSTGANLFEGYLEEIRISKGVARWTAAFTIPDEAYDEETPDEYTKLLMPCNVITVPNMTLQSVGYVSNYVPSSARIVVFEEDIDTMEANVDLVMEVSRDGGTSFSTVALAKDQEFGDGTLNLFSGSVDLTSQPNGELMVWRLKTQNNKDCRIRGVSLYWR